MVREALIAVLVYNILPNTMLMNILKRINLRSLRIYSIKLGMFYNLSSQASSFISEVTKSHPEGDDNIKFSVD